MQFSKIATIAATLLLAIGSALASSPQIINYPTTVSTQSGTINGYVEGSVRKWLGVPYAETERFAPPQPVTPWEGVLNTMAQKPVCPQGSFNPILPEVFYSLPFQDEDCTYMNVYAPASGHPNRRFPVLVFLHGDVHSTGASELDDKTGLVAGGDVIAVSFDYRLDKLAFPVLAGFETNMSNLWYQDQQMALHWVKNNIASFGGDPEHITYMGQYSGGVDAMLHIRSGSTSPQPQGIVVSNPSDFAYQSIEENKQRTLVWAAEEPRNCNQSTSAEILDCLRALSLADILAAPPSIAAPTFRATYGSGTVFASQPFNYFRSGDYNKNVKVMTGYPNGTGYAYALALTWYLSGFATVTPLADIPQANFESYMYFYFVQRLGLPASIYPELNQTYSELAAQPNMNYGKAIAAAIGEGLYFCPTQELLNITYRDNVTAYAFEFTHSPDNPRAPYSDLVNNPGYGTVPSYVFANQGQGYFQFVNTFSAFEVDELIPVMQEWWVNFARNGNPRNGWKKFVANDASGNHGYNSIGDTSATETVMAPEPSYDGRCAFWAQYR